MYFDFGGRKNLMDPDAWGSTDLRLTNGESILLTPKSRTGDFLSSSSGRSLEKIMTNQRPSIT